ncbi:hypothetical protein LCI18_004495 [Fusarium solani-melongenae]|uniref:Uncharacterized protein n=1 Tax=Fusarium solani subsp. cucurbitae TaxID=2747967 RepID=A0ACD3YXB0_FUSSC|nr:hypothetical protein LCI18_004495 [Fusarium solani-melongenae]
MTTDSNLTAEHSAVLVIGAGPVGLLVALRLGQAGIKTVLVEKDAAISELPRAVGYFAASQISLHKAKLYDKIRSEGFMSPGNYWRKATVSNSQGFRKLGEVIARLGLGGNDATGYSIGEGLLNLPQAALSKLILREVLANDHITVYFNQELVSIQDDGISVTATKKNSNNGKEKRFTGSYLVGADGARSQVRSTLNIQFPGHTWPDKLLTTGVLTKNHEEIAYPPQYILDPVNYVVMTPLEKPVLGERTSWRVVIGLGPEDHRPDEVVRSLEVIHAFYDKILPGPRPLDVKVTRSSVFKLHRRLAATLRRARCVLAGDAAHLCNCIEGGVNHMWTLSGLQLHQHSMVVADEDATLELQVKTVKYFKSIERVALGLGLEQKLPTKLRIGPNSPVEEGSDTSAGAIAVAPLTAHVPILAHPQAVDRSLLHAKDANGANLRSVSPDLVPDCMASRIG